MNWDFCWLYSDKFIKRSSSHKIYMKFVNPYERKIISTFNLAYGRICLVLFSSNLNKGYVNVYTVPFLTLVLQITVQDMVMIYYFLIFRTREFSVILIG